MKANRFYLIILFFIVNDFLYAGSGMQININAKVHFIVIDPLGRKTGRDPISNQRYKEIPRANYGNSGVDDHISLDEFEYSREFITSASYPPIDGLYQLRIIGLTSGQYQININIKKGNSRISLNKIGYSKTNEVFYYQFDYKSNPDSSIVLERVANSSVDIRRDLDILFEQGLITKQGFYNSLSEKLEEAEKKYEKGEIEAASEKLSSFFNKIAKKRDKHITEDAATILEEDTVALAKTWGVTLNIEEDEDEDDDEDDDDEEDDDEEEDDNNDD